MQRDDSCAAKSGYERPDALQPDATGKTYNDILPLFQSKIGSYVQN
jgi:hypothetical protein